MRAATCLSTSRESRRTCCAGMDGVRAENDCGITRRTDIGRRTPSWRAAGRRTVGDRRLRRSNRRSEFSCLRRAGARPDAPARRRGRPRQPGHPQTAGRARRLKGSARAAVPAALQSGLQSDRTGVRETQSVPPRRAPALLRPGHRARGARAYAVCPHANASTTSATAGIAYLGAA